MSVIVAVCAFPFAAFTWRASLEQNRRDLFLTVHERLTQIDVDIATHIPWDGINSRDDALALRDEKPDQWRDTTKVISAFDMLGLHVAKGYVDRRLALEVWGPSHAHIYEHARYVIDVYETKIHRRPWDYFESFGREATSWTAGRLPAATANASLDTELN